MAPLTIATIYSTFWASLTCERGRAKFFISWWVATCVRDLNRGSCDVCASACQSHGYCKTGRTAPGRSHRLSITPKVMYGVCVRIFADDFTAANKWRRREAVLKNTLGPPPPSQQTHQNGAGQQPSHEHGAEATAPCDRLVMALDRVLACDVALDDNTRGMRSVAVSGHAIEELCQLLL